MNRLPRTIRRAALVPAAVVAVLLASTGPATAAPAPTVGVTWDAAPCATGAITDFAGLLAEPSQTLTGNRTVQAARAAATFRPAITVSGWVQQCRETTFSSAYALGFYHTRASYVANLGRRPDVRRYDRLPAVTTFTRLAVFTGPTLQASELALGAMTAICVLRDNRVPIDCVGVDRSDPTWIPGVSRIATNDPRLQVPIVAINQIPGTEPSCGNCV